MVPVVYDSEEVLALCVVTETIIGGARGQEVACGKSYEAIARLLQAYGAARWGKTATLNQSYQ